MPGTLYIVSTPIGNLQDFTYRAVRILCEVTLIAAEDTRHTAKLLNKYHITTPTVSFHKYNEQQKIPRLLSQLKEGKSIALVSDAGTPTISDPGYRLVDAALRERIRVEPIPGASALLAAIASTGWPADSFTFLGFPPAKSNSRIKWFQAIQNEPRILIFFEAPHRIRSTLRDALKILGDRTIVLTRELTKVHEELIKGQISHVLQNLKTPRGEYTIVVGTPIKAQEKSDLPDALNLLREFTHIVKSKEVTRRSAIKTLAERHRMSSRKIYAALEKAKDLS